MSINDKDVRPMQEVPRSQGGFATEAPDMIRGTHGDPRFANESTTLKAPMHEVPHAMLMQSEANDRLNKAVETLHDRTTPLRHAQDLDGEERVMRDFGSELARSIADQAYRTDLAAQVVEKILTEMEL